MPDDLLRPERHYDPTPAVKPVAPKWGRMAARQGIATVARSMVGHHYLKGGKGARPGQLGGTRHRPGEVQLLVDNSAAAPAFYAASTSIPRGAFNVCGGRYSRAGRLVPESDAATREYLAKQSPAQWWQCSTVDPLTPRKIQGEGAKPGMIAWGENCNGWRHFDCIGLVEFCVEAVAVKPMVAEILGWTGPRNPVGTVQIREGQEILDGDIVSQINDKGVYHHIGLLYVEDGKVKVAQAEQTSAGVTTGKAFVRSDWSGGVWRLPDSLLKKEGEFDVSNIDSQCRPMFALPLKR